MQAETFVCTATHRILNFFVFFLGRLCLVSWQFMWRVSGMTSLLGLRIHIQEIRMEVVLLRDGTCLRLWTTLFGSDNWILRYVRIQCVHINLLLMFLLAFSGFLLTYRSNRLTYYSVGCYNHIHYVEIHVTSTWRTVRVPDGIWTQPSVI